jgi:hypothetical protein
MDDLKRDGWIKSACVEKEEMRSQVVKKRDIVSLG